MNPGFLTALQVAYLLDLDKDTVQARIDSGEIAAVKVNDEWVIPIKQVKQLLGLPTPAPKIVRELDWEQIDKDDLPV